MWRGASIFEEYTSLRVYAAIRERIPARFDFRVNCFRIYMRGKVSVIMEGIIVPVSFFSFLIACVITSAWKRKKIESIRHETARLLIEKNPAIDSATLARIFNPPPPALGTGAAHRMMKAAGSIVIATGLGLWAICLWFTFVSGEEGALALGGPAMLVMIVGASAFFAARFMPRPPANDAETGTSSLSSINRPER